MGGGGEEEETSGGLHGVSIINLAWLKSRPLLARRESLGGKKIVSLLFLTHCFANPPSALNTPTTTTTTTVS